MTYDTPFEEPTEPRIVKGSTAGAALDMMSGYQFQLSRPDVLFGGVHNRQAVTMVTAEELATELLKRVNPSYDPTDPHSEKTAKRFVASLTELCAPVPEWNFTTFPSTSDQMVVLGPIPFYTLCAHHVVPFHGHVWIGYVPNQLIAGLSKFARAVKHCAKGMWVQEELTARIAHFINDELKARGIAVVMKAEHMCMAMRGVSTPGVVTTTSEMLGVFSDHSRTAKAEFMEWIRESK
jgi:GTP cyclohydrolase IA